MSAVANSLIANWVQTTQVNHSQNPDTYKLCEITNVYCFKLPSLGEICYTAIDKEYITLEYYLKLHSFILLTTIYECQIWKIWTSDMKTTSLSTFSYLCLPHNSDKELVTWVFMFCAFGLLRYPLPLSQPGYFLSSSKLGSCIASSLSYVLHSHAPLTFCTHHFHGIYHTTVYDSSFLCPTKLNLEGGRGTSTYYLLIPSACLRVCRMNEQPGKWM